MSIKTLKEMVIDAINELKAQDVIVLDVAKQTSITDIMIICTGRSTRHVKSIAENVIVKAKENKLGYIQSEGLKEGEWAIVDLADVVVHVMLPATRELYHLEDLWGPVKALREQQG